MSDARDENKKATEAADDAVAEAEQTIAEPLTTEPLTLMQRFFG